MNYAHVRMRQIGLAMQSILLCLICFSVSAEPDVAEASKREPLLFEVPEGWRAKYFPKSEDAAADHYQLESAGSFTVLMRCNKEAAATFEEALTAAAGAGEPIDGINYVGLALPDTGTYASEKPIRMRFRVVQGMDCWLGSYGGTAADWQALVELLSRMKGV